QLFPSAVATFGAIDLATTDTNGLVYTWNNKVAIDGSIQVQSVGGGVNTTPTNIVAVTSGGTLTMSWPGDHLGWKLQTQTNSRSVGLNTNWVTVPGSDLVTSTNFPIGAA